MERLTLTKEQREQIGVGYAKNIPEWDKKLSEYEDSGLTPSQVSELVKAKAEGRLVVLPCKLGDIVQIM